MSHKVFETPNDYIPSGVWLAPALVGFTTSTKISNPFYQSNSRNQIETIEFGDGALKLIESSLNKQGVYRVQKTQVSDYASRLVNVARMIKESNHDLVLCPLRGGRLPGLQAQIICDDPNLFHPFDGTDMSRGTNDNRISEELRAILSDNRFSKNLRIAVLDHAKGGDSCKAMSRLLSQINATTQNTWMVDFYLLHQADHNPERSGHAYGYQNKRFRVQVLKIAVEGLLIEDESALLGYQVSRSDRGTYSQRLQVDGRLLIIESDKATLLKPSQIDEVLIGVVGEEIGNAITQISDAKLVDPDYWMKHKEEEKSGQEGS